MDEATKVTARIGLYKIPLSTRGWETAGQARYLFDNVWNLDYTEVFTRDIKDGLRDIDVLVMPDGYAFYALDALGREGKDALTEVGAPRRTNRHLAGRHPSRSSGVGSRPSSGDAPTQRRPAR